jgi:hypothetical protein
MRPGTLVRMSARFRTALRSNGSRQHVSEFGGCVGVVTGLLDYGDQMGPEIDVRWIPSYLRYAYEPCHLVLSRKKVRGWKNKRELARRRAAITAPCVTR